MLVECPLEQDESLRSVHSRVQLEPEVAVLAVECTLEGLHCVVTVEAIWCLTSRPAALSVTCWTQPEVCFVVGKRG